MYCQLGQVNVTKGLVELERRCQDTRQEIQVLSERQEILKSPMEDKLKLQSRANERYHDQIFEEIKELEQKKSAEALLMVQKKARLCGDIRMEVEEMKQEDCRALETREGVRKELGQDHPTSESCRSSMVDHVEVMTLEVTKKEA